jgi:HlyD family secretion protein
LKQQEELFAKNYISQANLDTARANYERDMARVVEMEAQIRSARLTIGRDKEIAAAQADVETARAVLAQSDWRLAQRAVNTPARSLVYDTFYSEGEWVQAGSPVVSLLPPANVKLRFFVPETAVGALKLGQPVRVSCDGCGNPIAAKISYISRQAEYTPPVIYSREQRAKLVFLIEARPEPADATRLHPGQPVDVALP